MLAVAEFYSDLTAVPPAFRVFPMSRSPPIVVGRDWFGADGARAGAGAAGSGERRALAVREGLAFRDARHTRYAGAVENERAWNINVGLLSWTQTLLAAPPEADAVPPLLAEARHGETWCARCPYVRTRS
jgi:hypothetical protein